ncbi:MAG: DUF4093 domain-containing protein, partial [Sporomusa sp.]
LGIGYANAKNFLYRLNHYGVTRREFNSALEQIEAAISQNSGMEES